VDGNDLLAVYEAATRAIARARAGEGATFLELMTYRWREHVGPKFDHELNRTYRSKSELDEWMQKDPVVRSASALVAMGAASMTETEEWALEVQAQIDADFDRARRAPWPETKAFQKALFNPWSGIRIFSLRALPWIIRPVFSEAQSKQQKNSAPKGFSTLRRWKTH
jgi:TPP-dependent pyruvate/acetoin dehydrogenase alpha subunit